MKALLVITWLLIGAAGYFAYGYYQQSLSDKAAMAQALNSAGVARADLEAQVASLKDRVTGLQTQLAEVKNALASVPGSVAPTSMPPAAQKTSIPSTITTLSGNTYTNCVLSTVTPDGISFFHSKGVAKILFPDLDPSFAATFGYNPVAAKQYQAAQAEAAARSDSERAAFIRSQETAHAAQDASASGAPLANQPAPRLTSDERIAIQAQIDTLQKDIAFMQQEENKLIGPDGAKVLRTNGASYSSGAYADKIMEEQAQVAQLQAKLH